MGERIGSFLDRFKKLTKPDETVRKTVSEVIKKETDIDLDLESISLKRNTVFLDTHGAIKNKIEEKREKIMEELKEKLGYQAPEKII